MSEKRKDEEKELIKDNNNEELLNKFGLEKGAYSIYDKDKEKEEINFDYIDFNINPFNNEEISKKEQKNKDELILEKKVDKEGELQKKYNDIQNRQKYRLNNYLNKNNENIEEDLEEKQFSSNNDINILNVKDNRKDALLSNFSSKTNYYNQNNNAIVKSYDIYPNINTDSKTIIPKSIYNSNSNYNPFLPNFNNQINYINNNNGNNQINYMNPINYINNYGNNQINFINNNNNNFFPMSTHQNWICSLCNNFNAGGKNLFIINYHFFYLIRDNMYKMWKNP